MRHTEHERLGMKGRVRFTVMDGDRLVRSELIENTITNGWLNRTRDAHMTTTDLSIRYLAWGDDNTAVAATDTELGNELGRKQVTQKVAGATGVLTVTTYIAPGEAIDQLEEWGLYGGAEDDLELVSHTLWSHDKTASESVQVDWSLEWSEAV